MADFDLTSLALSMVCPTNKLIMDDKGLPGVYVERIAQPLNALLTNGDNSIHPAFLYNGIQKDSLFFGKFQAKAHASRAYSLPGEDPTAYINFDTANNYCKNKGDGHHLMTAAEWAFLALLAKKMGTMPKGNNNYGKDVSESLRVAIPTSKDGQNTARVATGTGPVTWSDTGTIDGIFDLNGNVWEWLAGMRLVYGELQVIPYNNAADPTIDLSATSTAWRAIRAAATSYNDIFIQPNGTGTTSGSVKLDWLTNHWNWQSAALTNQADESHSAGFAVTTSSGLSDFCKMYLRAMALLPEDDDTDYGGDTVWANNGAAERLPFRGGDCWDGAGAGVFALDLDSPRSHAGSYVGFRAAFENL